MHPRYLLAPLATLLLLAAPRLAHAQTGAVGIGTTAPDASAALDIVSSSKGLLLPRVADATTIASPAPGLLVYQTGSPAGFYYNSGTAAAPSWQQLGTTANGDNLGNHTATTNLGLNGHYLSNAPGLANGLRVDNAGNVGVGVAAPSQALDVQGGILARNNSAISNQGAYLQWNRSGGAGETWLLNQQGGGPGGIRFGSATTGNAATEWARFDGSGNLGLGTTTPGQKLEVNGNVAINTNYDLLVRDANHGLGWYGSGKTWGSASPDGPVLYGFSGGLLGTNQNGIRTTALAWTNSGNVGIGTTGPSQKLDVDGNVRLRGLSGTDTRLPVVLPDGTLSTNAPLYAATTTTPALPGGPAAVVGTGSKPRAVAVSGTTAYVVNDPDNTLQLFDCSNPAAPVLLGTAATAARPIAVALVGTTAYVLCYGADVLQAFNCSNPASPVLVGAVGTGSQPFDLAISGTTAYVVNFNSGTVQAFNVANPASPALLGSTGAGINPVSVAVSGTTVFTGRNSFALISVIDFSNPTNPVYLPTITTSATSVRDLAVSGNRLYCVCGLNNLDVYDCTTPASVSRLSVAVTSYNPERLVVRDKRAYIISLDSNTLDVFDVSVSAGPTRLQQYMLGYVDPSGLALGGTTNYPTLYVTGIYSNTLRIFRFTGPARLVGVSADGSLTSLPTPDGNDFVQNQTSLQPGASFNVGGPGTVGGLLAVGGGASVAGNTVADAAGANTGSIANTLRFGSSGSGEGLGSKRANGGNAYGLDFYTNSLNRLAITSTGQVGIGISTPLSLLCLRQLTAQTATANVSLGELSFVGFNRTKTSASIQAVTRENDAVGELVFKTNRSVLGTTDAVERMRISADGNVGIGTTTPTAALDVAGDVFVYGKMGIGSLIPAQKLDVDGAVMVRGFGPIRDQGAHLQWNRSGGEGETWLINQRGGGIGGIRFGKSDQGNTTTEWARFDADGNLGIGTNNPSQKLTVIGNICASGGLNCASDGRYKRDVTPVQGALASVLKLRGVTYYWKQAEFPAKHFEARRQLGFIAQEIEPYYPEMVTTDADGYKSVDYSRLTPVLVEALKEQQQQIEALKQQVAAATAQAATAEAHAAQATADHADLLTMKAQLARLLGEQPTATLPAPARK